MSKELDKLIKEISEYTDKVLGINNVLNILDNKEYISYNEMYLKELYSRIGDKEFYYMLNKNYELDGSLLSSMSNVSEQCITDNFQKFNMNELIKHRLLSEDTLYRLSKLVSLSWDLVFMYQRFSFEFYKNNIEYFYNEIILKKLSLKCIFISNLDQEVIDQILDYQILI